MMARYRVVPRRVIPADYITDLKQRIDNLRRAVLQKNEEIERLRDTIRALAKDRADVVKQKEELEKESQALAKEKADLEATKKDRERLTGENSKLNESINALQNRISVLEAQLSEYEERIRDYESSIGQNKENAAGLEARIKQKDEEVSRLNEMISGHLGTIAELTEALNEKEKVIAEKDSVIKEKDSTINAYMRKTSELDRYLLEFRELKISERTATQLSRATLVLGAILGIVGAVFAIFAEPLVFSAGIANALRVKMAVTLLGLALPLGMISVTYRLFATRQSVLYLNVTGLVVAVSTLVLFDLYYPEGFLHPFAGTLYFLYALAVVMHFTAILLALPKVRSGVEAPPRGKVGFPYGGEMGASNAAKPEIPSAEEKKSEEVKREIGEEDEEDLFKPIR